MVTARDQDGQGSTWLELSVEADSESVEAVSELMSRYAYGHGIALYESYRQDPDGDNLAPDPNRPVRVVAYIPSDDGAGETIKKIQTGLWHLGHIAPVGELVTSERPEEDWANSWKEHFHPLRVGKRFVIRPTWREYTPLDGDLVIDLDPGMAFGTGHHPTTELCLTWMEELAVRDKKVLDVGAGSGILSIAAVLLGSTSVNAVEVDEVAGRVLRENLELNGVSGAVQVSVGDFGSGAGSAGKYELVVANIISSVLLRLVDPICAALAPHGTLLLSGVIDRHLENVRTEYQQRGLVVRDQRQIGDWFALLLTHDDPE